MAALPVQSSYLEASVEAPIRVRSREVSLAGFSEALSRTLCVFLVGTILGATAFGLGGHVLLERTRLEADASSVHLVASEKSARAATEVLRDAKARNAIDKWAARHGFIAPDSLSETSPVGKPNETLVASRQ